jgi:glucan phosphoethanolaminetransferase (alkaline phosphatase superfamily)
MLNKSESRKGIWDIVKIGVSLYGIFFTAATIVNSILALVQGHMYGTHEHVILRAVIVFIVVLAVIIVGALKINIWLRCLLAYVVAIALVLGYIWLSGRLFTELHPHAYRDIAISVSVFFVPLAAGYAIGDILRRRKKRKESS